MSDLERLDLPEFMKKNMNIPTAKPEDVLCDNNLLSGNQQTEMRQEFIDKTAEVAEAEAEKASVRKHLESLAQISAAYSEEEARAICKVFARRYPATMHEALRAECDDMFALISNINKMSQRYEDKVRGCI